MKWINLLAGSVGALLLIAEGANTAHVILTAGSFICAFILQGQNNKEILIKALEEIESKGTNACYIATEALIEAGVKK